MVSDDGKKAFACYLAQFGAQVDYSEHHGESYWCGPKKRRAKRCAGRGICSYRRWVIIGGASDQAEPQRTENSVCGLLIFTALSSSFYFRIIFSSFDYRLRGHQLSRYKQEFNPVNSPVTIN
jgi:hypothetical protein